MRTADALRALKLREIRGVIFDLDGTLVEYKIDYKRARSAAIKRIAKALPVTLDAAASRNRPRTQVIIERIRKTLGDEAAAVARRIFFEEFEKVEKVAASTVNVRDGVYEALDNLKERGFKVAIVTNNARRPVSTILSRHSRLAKLVDLVITRDDTGVLKPDPAGLLEAAKTLGISPRSLVVAGDTPTDIIAARRAGATPIGVLGGASSYYELAKAGALTLISTIRKITDLLQLQ